MMTGQGSDSTPFSPTQRAHNRTVLLKNVFNSDDDDSGAPIAPRRKASLVDNRVAEFELHFAKKREEMQAKLTASQSLSCDDSVSDNQRGEEQRSRSALRKREEEEKLMREVHKSLGLAQATEESSWDAYAHHPDKSPSQSVASSSIQKDGMTIPPPPMAAAAAQPTRSPSSSTRSSHRSSNRSTTSKSSSRYDSSAPFESNEETLHKPPAFQDSFAATHQKALDKIRKQRLEAEEKRKAAILEEARLLKLQAELLEQQALGAISEEEMKTKLNDKTDDDIDAQFGEMKLRSSSKSPGKHRDRSNSRSSRGRGRSRSKSKDKYSSSSRNRSKSKDGLRSSRHKDGLRTSRHSGKDKSPSKHREKSPSKHRDKSPSKSGREKSPSKHREKSPSKHRDKSPIASPSKHRDKSPSKSVSGRDKSPSKYGSAKDRSKRERERSRSAGRLRDSMDGDGTVASSSKRDKERSRSAGRLRDSSRSLGTSSRSGGTDFGESPPSSSRSILSTATSGSVDSCGVERVRKPRSRSSGALKRERVKSKSMRVASTTKDDDDDDVLYTPKQFGSSRSRSLVIAPSSSHSIKSSLSFPQSPVMEGNEGEEGLKDDSKRSSRSKSKDDKKDRLLRSRGKDPKKERHRSKSMSMVSTPDADDDALGPVSVHTTHSSAVDVAGNMSFVQLEVHDEEVETAGTKVLEALNTPSTSKRKGNKYLSPLVKQFHSPKVGRKKEKRKDKNKAGPFVGLNADNYS